jgi:hypothetical protein
MDISMQQLLIAWRCWNIQLTISNRSITMDILLLLLLTAIGLMPGGSEYNTIT